ncbi:hypothetical protein [Kribbella sp. NPDC004875]|uniref:hypothetical protein n=1 Tax=Kribbella sp. NPDC004875 TaxID=3364107 RepID=UPI0036999D37
MGQRSPLVTLAATAVGLVGLLIVNSTQATGSSGYAATPAAPSPTPTAEQKPTPTPTATRSTPRAPTPAHKPIVYIGRTAGREATLAVAVKGTRAVAYVCDGRRLEAWLAGTANTGRLTLRSRTGEHLIGTAAAGTLTFHGRTLRFTAHPAGPPAGLYRARNGSTTIGWIVLPDGSQVGIDNDGTPAAAPPLNPANRSATVDGSEVTAQSITGDETF